MAAIAAVLQILKSGDHLITLNNGYGGKRNVTKYIVEYDVNKARSDIMVTMKKQGTESWKHGRQRSPLSSSNTQYINETNSLTLITLNCLTYYEICTWNE